MMEPIETWWIPGGVHELRLLADEVNADGILVPPHESIERTRTPDVELGDSLPASIPPRIHAYASPMEIEKFCQQNDWNVQVKCPGYDAVSVSSWSEIIDKRGKLSAKCGTNDVIIQPDIHGSEISLSFAAHRGELVDAVFMEKRLPDGEGEPWTGHISHLSKNLRVSLEALLAELSWTGGGELNLIRDTEGDLHLVDWNPRFPAWIHGSTITGHNLPGQLLVVARGNPAVPNYKEPSEFTCLIEGRPIECSI